MRAFVTPELPGSGGWLSSTPEDFHVTEVLPYPPSGDGTHLFVQIEKIGIDTLEAARRLARAAGLPLDRGRLPPEVGIAGLKDRHARARQWISIPCAGDAPSFAEAESEELTVLTVVRHVHKLRRGHQRANRFGIVLRDVPAGGFERAQAILQCLGVVGVPNTFGPQRFGRSADNADRAREILAGRQKAPRDRRLRDLMMSALQSEIFNRVLAARIDSDLYTRVLEGDVVQKHDTGGMFVVEDAAAEQPRADALAISATGPLPGKKMRAAHGLPLELEAAALAAARVDAAVLPRLGPGTRRTFRYPLDPEARIDPVGIDAFRIEVTLPSGAYATVLLDELVKGDAPFNRSSAESGDDLDPPELAS